MTREEIKKLAHRTSCKFNLSGPISTREEIDPLIERALIQVHNAAIEAAASSDHTLDLKIYDI